MYFLAGVSTSLLTVLVSPRVDTAELVQLRYSLRGVQETIASHTCFEAPVVRSGGFWCCVSLLVLGLGIVGGGCIYLHRVRQLPHSVPDKEATALTVSPRRAKGPSGPPLQSSVRQ